jgi:hypothetical protein
MFRVIMGFTFIALAAVSRTNSGSATEQSRCPSSEACLARWRADFIGKVLFTLGTVDAPDKNSAIDAAATQFHVAPNQQVRIVVTRIDTPKREQQ